MASEYGRPGRFVPRWSGLLLLTHSSAGRHPFMRKET